MTSELTKKDIEYSGKEINVLINSQAKTIKQLQQALDKANEKLNAVIPASKVIEAITARKKLCSSHIAFACCLQELELLEKELLQENEQLYNDGLDSIPKSKVQEIQDRLWQMVNNGDFCMSCLDKFIKVKEELLSEGKEVKE